MSNSQFIGASFVDGLQAPHYVNGRLLTAEVLKADQGANLKRLSWLGKAAGYGVVEGLMVTQLGNTSLEVTSGLGFNRDGQPVYLPAKVTLPVAPQPDSGSHLDDAGRFQKCDFEGPGQNGSTPGGVYLLTAVPASRLEGLAPVKPGSTTTTPVCASKWEIEGIQFKSIRLTGFSVSGSGVTDSNRRNLLAHWCFGSSSQKSLARNPFTATVQFTGLDQIDAADLTSCDLPLAVFHWDGTKLVFVDVWSARRRLVQAAATTTWTGFLSDRRLAEGQARFLQFQRQLDALSGNDLSTLSLTNHFRYLPPTCFVPIRPPTGLIAQLIQTEIRPLLQQLFPAILSNFVTVILNNIQSQLLSAVMAQLMNNGFKVDSFLGNLQPDRIGLIDRETVDFTLQHSWYDEAIDLTGQPRLRLYIVKENLLGPIVALTTKQLQQISPVFTNSTFVGIAPVGVISVATILAKWTKVAIQALGNQISSDWVTNPNLVNNLGPLYAMVVKKPYPIQWVNLDQG